MQMKPKVNIDPSILIVIFILASTSLACQFFAGVPQISEKSIKIPGTSGDFDVQIPGSTIDDQNSRPIAFTLSEAQITEVVAQKLAANPDIPIKDPQIVLDNGQIDVYARFEQSILSANFHLTMKPVVTPSGKLNLVITDTDFGPLALPSALLDTISSTSNSFIADAFTYEGKQYDINSVDIADGYVTVEGAIQ